MLRQLSKHNPAALFTIHLMYSSCSLAKFLLFILMQVYMIVLNIQKMHRDEASYMYVITYIYMPSSNLLFYCY